MHVAQASKVHVAASIAASHASERAWDAVVVGAGPAGSLAGRELARRGRSVLLIDQSHFPRWKVCGCCLNVAALGALHDAGLRDLPARLGARPLNHWRICTRFGRAVCRLPGGFSLSREAFDTALIREAIVSGVNFLPETRAELANSGDHQRELEIDLHEASQVTRVRAAVLIVADGLAGRTLDGRPEFATSIARHARLGAGTVLDGAPDSFDAGTIYMASGRGGYVGLVRLEDGRLDLAAAFDHQLTRDAGSPAAAAARILEETGLPIPSGMLAATWRGTPALTRNRRCVAAERVFVIGDAAGYVEPFTGEGIAWALQSALAVTPLADEAVDGRLPGCARRWTRTYRRLIQRRQRNCRRLGALLKHPFLADVAVRMLAHAPWLAAPVIRTINAPAGNLPARKVDEVNGVT